MPERLPAELEVAAILRRAATSGDFAAVLRKGDPDRGSLLLVIASRGRHITCLERVLTLEGSYAWRATGPGESAGSADVSRFVDSRARFDEDLWAIELDIAEPERFIAETRAVG